MAAVQANGFLDIPASSRIEPSSFNTVPAEFPQGELPASVNADQVATEFIEHFNTHLGNQDCRALTELFVEEGHWRDHLGLSWDLRGLRGKDQIRQYLVVHGKSLKQVSIDRSAPHFSPAIAPIDAYGDSKCIAFALKIVTEAGTGQGYVRLIPQNGQWKAFAVYTALRGLNGFESPRGAHRPKGDENRGGGGTKNWREARAAQASFDESEPAVLIIGAGQGGLASAAHLKMLNVESLVIDRETRIGDNWRQRYKQLILHDPVWFDHMPYLDFPLHWPVFTPKDKLAEFFEAYAMLLELNVWTKTEMTSATWDDAKKHWTVTVERQMGDTKETRTFHPRHVIQATGHSGKKNFPTIKGMESFRGRLCHSSEFPGANPGSEGKRAVVVGSCNSGHDIAQDLYENGYDVTMVQRSSTCVASPPVDDADLILWSLPRSVHKAIQQQVTTLSIENDRATLEGLAKVGFKLDSGPDRAGLFFKYFQRGGGYYIDVGCSQLIIDGKIKIKQGLEIVEVLPEGLLFADGSRVEADEVVFATGYQNMRTQAREIFGADMAASLQDVWGFDEEGEWRTMWRRSGHPGFWFMGGNLALCRYYGRFLALQIKALEEGLIKE
ncbi:FAD/NAD(P)-binding domain-containing protein [Apiospora kogelbergensis]|uniref:FAD/NAD(P)-binding domain-containing protein n=1 Tax=Apiospora kogelbergensis TaxID=1337665 RepID=A0AAW0QEC2_9PEZI